ncbi:MAG: hypothetical protein J7559_12330 [Cohnella sp.]|nr:hypothetical protein [Cohnella sp.]
MVVTELYQEIFHVLANDADILDYLGIEDTLAPEEANPALAAHIQKRSRPQDLAENLPIIAFYAAPGSRESENMLVYRSPFIFDIYTSDDVSLGQTIAERIDELFGGQINPWEHVENFQSETVTAHERIVDLANVYCFTVVIEMSIALEK